MPLFNYTPKWDEIRAFYEKVKPHMPAGYSGLAGVRLHRTGNPLTVEIFGKSLPAKPLHPLVVFQVRNREPVEPWAKIEDAFDTPWVSPEDLDRFRNDVMRLYSEDAVLEPRAHAILNEAAPGPELLAKAIVDHAGVLQPA